LPGGGLTATRAKDRFYQSVLDWKPDKVLLVVMTRTDADYEALKDLGLGFKKAESRLTCLTKFTILKA
jgi:hypothetical protein